MSSTNTTISQTPSSSLPCTTTHPQTPSDSMPCTTTSQAPSSSVSDSVPCTTISQTQSSSVSDLVPCTNTNSQTPSSSTSESMPSTTISQTHSTFVSTSTPKYDVFLSFRGEDTRLNFTGHLYQRLHDHGIKTFMDEPELRRGQVISDALLYAIRNSKTYIVVLSQDYASSSWCLDELVEILNCHKTMQRLVLPVFFNIDPSVVRRQTGTFEQAFKKHQVRIEMEKVNTWRVTLTQVADLSGFHICENKSEALVNNEILHRLLIKINPKTLHVADYLVGLDSRVEDITTLLSSGTEGVIRFGIYGMGGVGKTTLAKAIYNQLVRGGRFKGSCFLANVRENSGTEKGLASLQEQLINDVLCSTTKVEVHNVAQGIELIEARICSTKLVVVIDDLDDLQQFQSLVRPFASESVVIITTRNEEILIKTEVETGYRYMVNTLDDADSLALFKRHAFGDDEPNDILMELSKDILCLAGGLPLALEVFGAYLRTQRSEEGWKYYINKLQRDPDRTIQQKLIISLDAVGLEDRLLKQIFLDIACFFIGEEKEEVVEIMETFYLSADLNIDTLKKRCLLTINRDKFGRNELGMHDLLRDVGREIARNNSPNEPGNYSRLWLGKDICDVLENHSGTKAIECIIYKDGGYGLHGVTSKLRFLNLYKDGFSFLNLTTKTFKRMSKLRFLHLIKVNLTGSFAHIFKDLRWLRWDFCRLECLPSEFYPQQLVILELSRSNMRAMWELNKDLHVFGKLKTLDMSYSKKLSTTDFTRVPYLKTLDLDGCQSLEEVHTSIGSLASLVSLNLSDCKKLKSLPDSICDLRALEVLTISGCDSMEAMPIQLGDIKSLTNLDADRLTVSKLPDSIGNLTKLVELDLRDNKKLETLPDTICNLRSLEILDISGCSSLEAMPIQLGNIDSLTELKAERLTVSKLPDSIGHLTKLVALNLRDNKKLESLPDTICNLRSLEILDIGSCSSLKALPTAIGNIETLKKIDWSGLTVSKLPESIGSLTKLVELDLRWNKKLETLPDSICNLRSLKILEIAGCERLETLPGQLWKITSLGELNALGATMLKKLPDIGSSQNALPLQKLDLCYSGITALPSGFSQLANLELFMDVIICFPFQNFLLI